jgi:hypothetical protein
VDEQSTTNLRNSLRMRGLSEVYSAETIPLGQLAIPVGIPLTGHPPDGPGRALISASGSSRR